MNSGTLSFGRLVALPVLTVLMAAAAPQPKTFDLRYRSEGPFLTVPTSPVVARPTNSFIVAPTPNRDIAAPAGPASVATTTLAPSLFTRSTQNRGEGFLAGSTAQSDQERRVTPGAGFNLRMPIQK